MKTLAAQFKNGILELDGISYLLHCLKEESIYVIGGAEDFRVFLMLMRIQNISRCQLVVRDYEPHFVAIDVYITLERVQLLVVDSTPNVAAERHSCDVVTERCSSDVVAERCSGGVAAERCSGDVAADYISNNGYKWYILTKDIFPDRACYIYTNPEKLQADEYSCKLFSINFARRLARYDPEALYFYLHSRSIQYAKDGFYLLAEHSLPTKLMRDVQSLTRLHAYRNARGDSYEMKMLLRYVDKHTRNVNVNNNSRDAINNVKKRNLAILHKLEGYTRLISIQPSYDCSECLCYHLGLDDINGLSYDGIISAKHNDDIEFWIPFLREIPIPQEAPFAESNTSVFFKKCPEDAYDAKIPWSQYKEILKNKNPLTDTWVQVDFYHLKYHVDFEHRCAILEGSMNNIRNCIMDILYQLKYYPNNIIKLGCSQPLATHVVLTSMLKDLMQLNS